MLVVAARDFSITTLRSGSDSCFCIYSSPCNPPCFATCQYLILPPSTPSVWAKTQKRADVVGAEALYKKAGTVDPCHANSIYNYAVLLDSSLKQQEVRQSKPTTEAGSGATRQLQYRPCRSVEVASMSCSLSSWKTRGAQFVSQ